MANGLLGNYYNGTTLADGQYVLSRVDPNLNLDFATNPVGSGLSTFSYSVKWTGTITFAFTEVYNLYFAGHDGVKLVIDGQIIFDSFTSGGPDYGDEFLSAGKTFSATANKKYNIEVYYFQSSNISVEGLTISWSSPSRSVQAIPSSAFFPLLITPNEPDIEAEENVDFIDLNITRPTNLSLTSGSNLNYSFNIYRKNVTYTTEVEETLGLINYWKLDDTFGNAKDSISNSNLVSTGSTIRRSKGPDNQPSAVYFDGVSYFSGTGLTPTHSAITLEFWINTPSGSSGGGFFTAGGLIAAGIESVGFGLKMNGSTILQMFAFGVIYDDIVTGMVADTWNHIAIVSDPVGQTIVVYCNGLVTYTTPVGFGSIRDFAENPGIYIGQSLLGYSAGYFTGFLSNFAWYGRLLSEDEVIDHYLSMNKKNPINPGVFYKINKNPVPWNTETYTDKNIEFNALYKYYVSGFNGTVEGAASNIVSAIILRNGNTMLKSKTLRGFQFGLEDTSTQGTVVASDKWIKNGTFTPPKRQNNVKTAQDDGTKSAIGQQRGKRWAEWSISGQLGYSVMPYWAAMLITATPVLTTPGTLSKKRVYKMNSRNVDTPQTMTFEYGNNQGSNDRMAFGTATDMTITINENTADYTINGFGAYPDYPITLTASPTLVPANLMNMTDFDIFYSNTLFSDLGTSKLLQARALEFSVKGKYKSKLFINSADTTIGGILEKKADIGGKITVAVGSESDKFLASLEQSTLGYLQFVATGSSIETVTMITYYNSFKTTLACYVSNQDLTDDDDLYAGMYDFYAADEETNGDLVMETITAQAAL